MSERIDVPAGGGMDMRSIYSETVIEHAARPRNAEPLASPDGYAVITGPCGDTMQIWLRVRDNVVTAASFTTDGCGPSISSGSIATEMIAGKSPADAMRISQKDILEALGGLPEDSSHCALLAANTVKAAIRDYLAFKNEPWKRAYQR